MLIVGSRTAIALSSIVFDTEPIMKAMVVFKSKEAANLFAKRLNVTDWIYKII